MIGRKAKWPTFHSCENTHSHYDNRTKHSSWLDNKYCVDKNLVENFSLENYLNKSLSKMSSSCQIYFLSQQGIKYKLNIFTEF